MSLNDIRKYIKKTERTVDLHVFAARIKSLKQTHDLISSFLDRAKSRILDFEKFSSLKKESYKKILSSSELIFFEESLRSEWVESFLPSSRGGGFFTTLGHVKEFLKSGGDDENAEERKVNVLLFKRLQIELNSIFKESKRPLLPIFNLLEQAKILMRTKRKMHEEISHEIKLIISNQRKINKHHLMRICEREERITMDFLKVVISLDQLTSAYKVPPNTSGILPYYFEATKDFMMEEYESVSSFPLARRFFRIVRGGKKGFRIEEVYVQPGKLEKKKFVLDKVRLLDGQSVKMEIGKGSKRFHVSRIKYFKNNIHWKTEYYTREGSIIKVDFFRDGRMEKLEYIKKSIESAIYEGRYLACGRSGVVLALKGEYEGFAAKTYDLVNEKTDDIARLLSEIEILKGLSMKNRHCPTILAAGKFRNRVDGRVKVAVVMDLFEPIDLRVGSFHQKLLYFRQLIDAVSFLHDNKFIHRDLKPSNIMAKGGVIKVLDFEAGRGRFDRVVSMTKMPSSVYLPEEATSAKKIYDFVIDNFSIGVMAAEMFRTEGGRFCSVDERTWFFQKLYQTQLPSDLHQVILGLTSKRSSSRMSLREAGILVDELIKKNPDDDDSTSSFPKKKKKKLKKRRIQKRKKREEKKEEDDEGEEDTEEEEEEVSSLQQEESQVTSPPDISKLNEELEKKERFQRRKKREKAKEEEEEKDRLAELEREAEEAEKEKKIIRVKFRNRWRKHIKKRQSKKNEKDEK